MIQCKVWVCPLLPRTNGLILIIIKSGESHPGWILFMGLYLLWSDTERSKPAGAPPAALVPMDVFRGPPVGPQSLGPHPWRVSQVWWTSVEVPQWGDGEGPAQLLCAGRPPGDEGHLPAPGGHQKAVGAEASGDVARVQPHEERHGDRTQADGEAPPPVPTHLRLGGQHTGGPLALWCTGYCPLPLFW